MYSIFIVIFLVAGSVWSGRYEFVFDNSDIIDNCSEIPGNNGIHDLFNISEIKFDLMEGRLGVSGNTTSVWEGVEPTDRIDGHGELYRFQRGAWQVTPVTLSVTDFCKTQFDPSTVWYQVWTKNIPPNERKCINVYGHIYHYEPAVVDTIFNYPINMEGRHKFVAEFMAYDQWNKRRPKTICVQISGEITKVKYGKYLKK
ncbi:uncharacterized protein [Musca autumnalis]|uniref:uncharacterized protein n=1 Tax=Musca autumnalis TaxID=221902 RepID=UPI003CE81A2B